jgi:hypothetical protein
VSEHRRGGRTCSSERASRADSSESLERLEPATRAASRASCRVSVRGLKPTTRYMNQPCGTQGRCGHKVIIARCRPHRTHTPIGFSEKSWPKHGSIIHSPTQPISNCPPPVCTRERGMHIFVDDAPHLRMHVSTLNYSQ